MQTFMPYANFEESLRVLDDQRLGKQRVEGFQIIRTLTGISAGWRQHPAVKMWRGAVPALIEYTLLSCEEWQRRGNRDSITDKIYDLFHDLIDDNPIIPAWTADPRVIDSHKAMLFHKNPTHYKLFESYSHIKEYYWPI